MSKPGASRASRARRKARPAPKKKKPTKILETARAWTEPAPMDTGTRLPVIVTENGTLWVAYRAQTPDDPAFGVLRFDKVTEMVIASPSDERLPALYGRSLELHSFHRVHPLGRGQRRWIVTFHDRALYVRAARAQALPLQFAAAAEEAIASAQSLGPDFFRTRRD